MTEKQEKLFNEWLKNRNQTDKHGVAAEIWQACLEANGIKEIQAPNCEKCERKYKCAEYADRNDPDICHNFNPIEVSLNCKCNISPRFDLSGVPDELKKLTLEELLNGDVVKIMNDVFHGTHDPKNWEPKPNEIVLVKISIGIERSQVAYGFTVSHVINDIVFLYHKSIEKDFISTNIKNVKPFDASKVGKPLDEI